VVRELSPNFSNATQLFAAVRPALSDDRHTGLQKRAYAVVASILQHHSAFVHGERGLGLPRLEEVVQLMQQSLVTVSSAARRGTCNA